MPITEAKVRVPSLDLVKREAASQGKTLERAGKEESKLNCLLPDHDEKTPSFFVNEAKNEWYCFGCHRGGDVVELARLLWGYEKRESHVAAAELLLLFGHEIPQRPDAWFRRQARQKPVRDRIREARVEHVAMLVFRLVWMPWLKRLPEDVREDAKEGAWRDALWMADRIYSSRRSA